MRRVSLWLRVILRVRCACAVAMGKNKASRPVRQLTDGDYVALAALRQSLRAFLAFSEDAAEKVGLTPRQHQALLAIRGSPEKKITVGKLANNLLLKPHTAVGLVNRLSSAALVRRKPDLDDRRRVLLLLTAKDDRLLRRLSTRICGKSAEIRPS